MKKLRPFICLPLTLMVAHLLAPMAAAHPLGNFTINHYAGLQVGREVISIDYVLDMAEIPAFQEISRIDANRNSQPDSEEIAAYHPAQCETIRSELDLRLDGNGVALQLDASSVEFPPGAGGLLTLRLTCAFRAAPAAVMLAGATARIDFKDDAYRDRLGWREIVVTGEGVGLPGDIATTSVSQRLTAYPDDMLSSPLDQRQVSFDLSLAPMPRQQPVGPALPLSNPLTRIRDDAFTRLITLQNLSLPTLLFALAIAFVWGAAHGLTPGHGKTIVGAYLVGTRGTPRHAVYLGLTTTITHTAGVFALGLVTLFATRFIMPERLYPWLGVLSGLLVVVIGLNLFASRLRGARLLGASWGDHSHAAHDSHERMSHLHHDHDYADHVHSHVHHDVHAHEHNPHEHDHTHVHPHSHLPPGADGSPVTWRSLLALGISGGLLPCPSALVVLLSAIALNRIGFGLVLVLAFSLGLAGVLTGIGLLLVYAGRLFARLPAQSRAIQLIPAASALFIAAVGVGITLQALSQIEFFKL